MKIKIFLSSLLLGFSCVALSAPVNNLVGDLVALKRLPAHSFSLAENEFGDLFLISDSGRFAIQKPVIYDVWNAVWINSINDLKTGQIDLNKMGLDIDELQPFKIGKGDSRITVFVDPISEHTRKLLSFVNKNSDAYAWNIVLFPAFGEKSAKAARKIACDGNSKRAYEALITGDFSQLKPKKKCNTLGLQKALTTSKYLGIRRIPYTINAKGFISTGYANEQSYKINIDKSE